MAAISTLVAGGLDGLHDRPLGDDPLAMLLFGCVLAFTAGMLRLAPSGRLGLAAMAGFPLWAVIDLTLHGGHNLLPFEFAIYGIYGLIGCFAAAVGRRLARP